jgi:hypothetical protein
MTTAIKQISDVWEMEGVIRDAVNMASITECLWQDHRSFAATERQRTNDDYYRVMMNDDEMDRFHFALYDMKHRIDLITEQWTSLTEKEGAK